MKAYFDLQHTPRVDLTVLGLDGGVEVSAAIDTGFEGALMLALPLALAIGLKLASVIPIALADGSIRHAYVFEGQAVLDDGLVPVDILLNAGEESLIGTALLKDRQLIIDFAHRRVRIAPSPAARGG